jgi:putative DNA primase/helicase
MSPLESALDYLQRGYAVIPVPYKDKNPGFDGWQQLRVTSETATNYFNGAPQNIGCLVGEPSGWIVDIDLDHKRAVELAPEFLPPTPAVFGRPSKCRSHFLYRVTSPIATKKFKSKSAGMIVEIRSTGQQTVFPPSTHESGEAITWETEGAEPAAIDPDLLLAAVTQLADTVKIELGEKAKKKEPKPPKQKKEKEQPGAQQSASDVDPQIRAKQCLASMLRIGIVDQNDGSARLFCVACRSVEYDLDDGLGVATIRAYARQKPFAKEWSDDEILQRIRDAEKQCTRGVTLDRDADGCIHLGGHDPQSGRLVLSPSRTLPTAEAFIREFQFHPDGRTMHCYASLLWHWTLNRYAELEDNAVKQRLQSWLHGSLRYVYNKRTDSLELVDFQSNPATINSALESIRAFTHLPISVESPSWIGDAPSGLAARDILPCRSKLLHLPTNTYLPATPKFFTVNALEFDPDPNAPAPSQWYAFLHQLFDGDVESLDLLQEWFGYCLTGDTSQQKMMLIVGPTRSGKGTLARVLGHLIGRGNICGPTTSSLAEQFGLQPLLGKSLAIVSDARFHGDKITTVVERLLCITGEDEISVPRKYLGAVDLKLPIKFMFLTNELPKFTDASNALVGRFVILRLTQSFYGKEDPDLTNKLLSELPGILNWGIQGWHRLRTRGRFVMPSSVSEVVRDLEDSSSPVKAFVRDACLVGPGRRVSVDCLYLAWKDWCLDQGRDQVGTKQTLGRNLTAAYAEIRNRRGTDDGRFYEGIALR